MEKLIVSPSPHQKGTVTTQRIMLHVIIALLPASAAACYFFGLRAGLLLLTCVASAVGFEFLLRLMMKKTNTIGDLSAVVTGLLLGLNLPVTLPLWMAAIGSFVAIAVVKQLFGGLGQNFANPAIVGRIVLMVSFAPQMTNWVKPFFYRTADLTTSATPLADGLTALPSYLDLFLGNVGGSIGETSALALLIGGVYLMLMKVISISTPFAFLGSLALFSLIAGGDPLYQVLSGGAILGAFFMATDYATTPINTKGKLIFGLGCGAITFLIRQYGTFPEGVSFAILLMNIITPYIDRFTKTKPLGKKRPLKTKEVGSNG